MTVIAFAVLPWCFTRSQVNAKTLWPQYRVGTMTELLSTETDLSKRQEGRAARALSARESVILTH